MKLITFTYTKEDNNSSDRVFIPLASPTDKYFGIDISELEFVDQGLIWEEVRHARATYDAQIAGIMAKYDIKHSFRSFMPSKMTDITSEG